MVEKFEIGKTYRFTGDASNYNCYAGVNCSGMSDGLPRKCIASNWEGMIPNKLSGNFEGIPCDPDNLNQCWDFSTQMDDFEEVIEE